MKSLTKLDKISIYCTLDRNPAGEISCLDVEIENSVNIRMKL
jgi:hypothetical protein